MKYSCMGLALLIPLCAHAGTNGLTHHSRANCAGFNESISWHAGHRYSLRVKSYHIQEMGTMDYHMLDTDWRYTWRAAAFHATEAYSSRGDHWTVQGIHYQIVDHKEKIVAQTEETDCNLDDGWID